MDKAKTRNRKKRRNNFSTPLENNDKDRQQKHPPFTLIGIRS